MWLLNIVPDWLIHLVAWVSAITLFISFFLKVVPAQYRIPAQVAGSVLLVLSVWLAGGAANNKQWEIEIAKRDAEIAELKAQADKVTVEVITKYVDRVKVVKEKGDVIIKEIPKLITKEIDRGCQLPPIVGLLHNSAATNTVPSTTQITDAVTAGKPGDSGSNKTTATK